MQILVDAEVDVNIQAEGHSNPRDGAPEGGHVEKYDETYNQEQKAYREL